MKIIILAGGGGTRLWPLSRESRPKQFNKLVNDKTLLENTLERFKNDYNEEDIYISTNPQSVSLIKEILPNFPGERMLIEPEKRDTGPAMGFVAARLFLKFPDEPMVFIPSDHFIADVSRFIRSLKIAEEIILKTGKMLDIAITPLIPSTVLGYTKVAGLYQRTEDVEIYHFAGHHEKPDLETALKYLKDGNYLWHGNYYMWTPRLFLEAYKRYAPGIYERLEKIIEAFKLDDSKKVSEEFSQMEKISIDYAITEKMDPSQVLIIKGDFGWSDIGAFDVLYDKLKGESDSSGNIVRANHLGLDTKNCLIYGQKNKKIATIGVSDLVIIDTLDALLVCPKERSQDVKKVVEKLKENQEEKYL